MNSGPGRAVGIQVSVDVELFLVGVLITGALIAAVNCFKRDLC